MAEPRSYKKPLPRVDEESRGYWEALARHELYFQRCRDCGTARFYPRALCPACLSSATEWVRASGRGKVYTFTVTHQNQNQPLGISTGALMSRMSPLKAFVPALLVAEDRAGMMTAEELVFIYMVIHDDGAFPVFQKISPARRRRAGLFATGSSRFARRETV